MVDDTPDDLVFELHNEALWGAHPYGYSILGTRDTVVVAQRRATCGRCTSARTIRRSSSSPRRATWSTTRCSTTLERTGWARRAARRRDAARSYRRRVPQPPRAPARRARRRADAHRRRQRRRCRTRIRAAMPSSLLSMLLGGGMSSRLFQRVREELGLAYSVYTFQSFHADVGMHGVYVGTAPETARDGARRDPRRARRRRRRTDCPTTSSRWARASSRGRSRCRSRA